MIIAELSGNHNGSLQRALEIVEAAAEAGAHAVKLQTYTADTMTLDVDRDDFLIDDPQSLWHGRRLHELYDEAHTPWDWHAPIMERARELGLLCFSSPFDETAVDFLEGLDVPAYKIASFEIVHLPLIRSVAATGKPMLISSGMASLAEIEEAVTAAREAGCKDLLVFKCTSTYPASPENSNVLSIPDLRRRLNCQIGLSDHTMGIGCALAAVAHGATAIEKHFTLRRADGGVDSAFSLEPAELRLLVEESERAWQALGEVSYGPSVDEQESLMFRRSIYVTADLAAGEKISRDNVRVIRPGFGLAPKHFDEVLGKTINQGLSRGTALRWDMLGE